MQEQHLNMLNTEFYSNFVYREMIEPNRVTENPTPWCRMSEAEKVKLQNIVYKSRNTSYSECSDVLQDEKFWMDLSNNSQFKNRFDAKTLRHIAASFPIPTIPTASKITRPEQPVSKYKRTKQNEMLEIIKTVIILKEKVREADQNYWNQFHEKNVNLLHLSVEEIREKFYKHVLKNYKNLKIDLCTKKEFENLINQAHSANNLNRCSGASSNNFQEDTGDERNADIQMENKIVLMQYSSTANGQRKKTLGQDQDKLEYIKTQMLRAMQTISERCQENYPVYAKLIEKFHSAFLGLLICLNSQLGISEKIHLDDELTSAKFLPQPFLQKAVNVFCKNACNYSCPEALRISKGAISLLISMRDTCQMLAELDQCSSCSGTMQ